MSPYLQAVIYCGTKFHELPVADRILKLTPKAEKGMAILQDHNEGKAGNLDSLVTLQVFFSICQVKWSTQAPCPTL